MTSTFDAGKVGADWFKAVESRVWRIMARRGFSTVFAVGLVILAILLGTFTYMLLTGLTPLKPSEGLIIALLIANLAIVLLLFALICWRIIRIIMARVSGTAGAKLHARLVTMFVIVAVMPAIIVAVFAGVTLNRGLDRWFSDRLQLVISNAQSVAEAYMNEHDHVLRGDVLAMATDLDRAAPYVAGNPQRLQKLVAAQAILRSLPSAYVVNSGGRILAKAVASMAPEIGMPTAEQMNRADQGEAVLITVQDENQIRALVKLNAYQDAYLYVARIVDAKVLRHLAQSREAVSEYEDLEKRRFTFQITFALIYVAVALITLLAAIWLGLWAANRIVEPISRLVRASERVREGDLSTRVEMEGTGDEIDDLSNSFNRMTSQLEGQRTELVAANHQLDQRSQFTEAVLSGVSAGVLGLDNEGHITLANRAALRFFGKTADEMIGRNIMVAVPEMYGAVSDARAWPERTAHRQVVLLQNGQERTLNIRVTREMTGSGQGGFVLTFDDITELVHAQRTAAWADVARRIAHEIKNPLTPIQLSAERIRRKYGKEITTDPEIFEQCTSTIIRQVNDIGRMVDEFSSFARMPSALIKIVDLNEVLRQAVFLQRVANSDIDYALSVPETSALLECDGRLVSQALTNILKNAAEAIRGHDVEDEDEGKGKGKGENDAADGAGEKKPIGRIDVALSVEPEHIVIQVTDSGCGLPETDRMRLTEPYMTTRAKGTGLGLAIVNKVMEDHGGQLELDDAPAAEGWESGARITLRFPRRHKPADREKNTDDAAGSEDVKEEAVNGI